MSKNLISNDKIRELNRIFGAYKLDTKEDTARLTIGKTYKYTIDRTYINLYYNDERIIFQTPMLYIPYAPRITETNSTINPAYQLDASFYNNSFDQTVIEFETWIKKLETHVIKLVKKRPYLNLQRDGFNSVMKKDDYRHCQKMTLKLDTKLSNFYMLESRNKLGDRVNFSNVKYPCYAVFIIEINTIWIKRTYTELDTNSRDSSIPDYVWGLGLSVHAAQCVHSHPHPRDAGGNLTFIPNPAIDRMLSSSAVSSSIPPPPPPMPLTLSFASVVSNQSVAITNPILEPYLKMIKLGIPREAVKQKMQMDGHPPELLDNPTTARIPPPPPAMPGIFNLSTTHGPVKITANMLTAVKLKRAESNNDNNDNDKSSRQLQTARQKHGGFQVSLSDILNMKSRLKKRDVANEADSYHKMYGPHDNNS